jgi:transcriptional regulator with AAA-type ATPase domain
MPFGFKDLMVVDRMPGMPDLVKYQAQKRKRGQYDATGNTGEAVSNEALTVAQRRKKALQMKRYSSRLKIGRKKAMSRMADRKRLEKRAQKAARNFMAKRLTKGIAKAELTPARKQEIEKRLDKMKPRIAKIAKKLMPAVR